MASVNSVFSFKALTAITAAVLAVHLAALQASPVVMSPRPAEPILQTFITRSIEPAAPPLAPAADRPALAVASPPRPHARPAATRPAAPQVAAAARGRVQAAMPPPLIRTEEEEVASIRPEDATTPDPPLPGADQLALAPGKPAPPSDAPLPAAVDQVPGPVRLTYQVLTNKFPYQLGAELLWQPNGEQYKARLEISAFGQARVQTSRGEITPQGLAPLRFSDKFRSEVAAHFNRAQGKVTFSANTPDAPLRPGAQDRLSVLVQLAAMLVSAPQSYPRASTITIQTIGPRAADSWQFTVGDTETLTLPGGQQATIKLLRNPREAFDQKVEVWLAPALGYLPARIRITETNGDYVDQQWLASEPLI